VSDKKKIEYEKKLKDKKEAKEVSNNKEIKRQKVEAYLNFINADTLAKINNDFIEDNKSTLHIKKYIKD